MFGEFVLWSLLFVRSANTEIIQSPEPVQLARPSTIWQMLKYIGDTYAHQSDPNERMHVLMNQSEHFGPPSETELEHFWMVDQPPHLTPNRTDGGTR